MWDHVDDQHTRLTHDRPCVACGHALHVYLPCSDTCACRPELPASAALAA